MVGIAKIQAELVKGKTCVEVQAKIEQIVVVYYKSKARAKESI